MAIQYDEKSLSSNLHLKKYAEEIYNIPLNKVAIRLSALISEHRKAIESKFYIFSSPGRIEVIGNHTDHNHGEVLAAAVSVDLLAIVSPSDSMKVTVNSVGYPLVEVDLNDLSPKLCEIGCSEALVRGVAKGFRDRGYKIGGFFATTTSDVFKGAGMSSSAAFEVLVAEIFNVFYNNSIVDPITKAIVSQYAENIFFGKPSGLMDQSAISFGGISHIDFKDPSHPIAEKLNWPFEDVSVAVVNCGGDHANLTPQYAAIRTEMEEVAKSFSKAKLRDVEEKYFWESLPKLKTIVSGRAILRAIHFFEENKRVNLVYNALKKNIREDVFNGINESGISSYELLQNCYAENDPSQTIPLALAICKKLKGVKACRVHGGGFAGTILVFLEKDSIEDFKKEMGAVFGEKNIYLLKIRNSGTKMLNIE